MNNSSDILKLPLPLFKLSNYTLTISAANNIKPLKSLHEKFGRIYRKISNISHTLVGNKTVDHSDVVGAAPVGAASTTSSLST